MKKPVIKMGSVDFVLFCTILLLVTVGVIMVYSASSYTSFFGMQDSMFFLKKQALWAVIGIIAMFFTIKLDYHLVKKHIALLMIVTTALLLVVFAFPANKGAQRWIPLGFASLQPSEIAKYVVVAYTAKSLENKGENVKSFFYGIIPYFIVSGIFAALVLAEKNLSIASVIMIVTIIMIFVGGSKISHLVSLASVVGVLGVIFILIEPYRLDRLLNFRNPWADARDKGYQLIQSLLALGSGGITGLGIGQSRQKCYYIPEPHNDFIFSIIGEEMGFIGTTFVVLLFIIFVWRGIKIAMEAKDTFGSLLAVGITSVVAVQALINIAVVTGSMPVTGVPLPFISYGGSSLVLNLMAMGVLLNISRQSANA